MLPESGVSALSRITHIFGVGLLFFRSESGTLDSSVSF